MLQVGLLQKDSLNITKLDVLTGLKQIRVAIAYRPDSHWRMETSRLFAQQRRNRRMTEVRLPSGYFPSHLDDLKAYRSCGNVERLLPEKYALHLSGQEVVCEYVAWPLTRQISSAVSFRCCVAS